MVNLTSITRLSETCFWAGHSLLQDISFILPHFYEEVDADLAASLPLPPMDEEGSLGDVKPREPPKEEDAMASTGLSSEDQGIGKSIGTDP